MKRLWAHNFVLLLVPLLSADPLPDAELLRAESASVVKELPSATHHFVGLREDQLRARAARRQQHPEILVEQLRDEWFAALVSLKPDEEEAISLRFGSWRSLIEFIEQRGGLVESWAYVEGDLGSARRLSAHELQALRKGGREPPTFVTLTLPDSEGGRPVNYRIEFGFGAAATALAADRSYRRHRALQLAGRQVLGARDKGGRITVDAQYQRLTELVQNHELELVDFPAFGSRADELFVAFEFEPDEFGNYSRAVSLHRAGDLEKRMDADQGGQMLLLRRPGDNEVREVRGYRRRGYGDTLELVPNPIPGQDLVELRVVNPGNTNVYESHVLEFGEPEILKESALAQFGLLNAHLEKKRRELAVKRADYDLIAEPIFAGLNVGGGLAAVGFPVGEGARLIYNLTAGRKFIPKVPNPRQLRELFALLAARRRGPVLYSKAITLLTQADYDYLERMSQQLTEAEVQDFLAAIQDEDLKAMVRLAQFQRLDAQVSNLLSILSEAAKVTGLTESEIIRMIFDNPYLSVTGEISINYIIAALVGAKVATPLSGYTLQEVSRGDAPTAAWLQYFNVTVDLRAVVNTVARLSARTFAERELDLPFPHATRLSDLAAYEIRVFGFPLLLLYKRGLLRADYKAYVNDYAYGVIGTRVVEHFRVQGDLNHEIRAGRMFPLGFVRLPDGNGGWQETSLVVFAHRIPSGRHRGRTAIVLYGLKAYAERSLSMQREYERFKAFGQALEVGGVIEQLIDAEDTKWIPASDFEPQLHVGTECVAALYERLLADLLEVRRYLRLVSWRAPISAEDSLAFEQSAQRLAGLGVRSLPGDEDPLVDVDRYFSRFKYRTYIQGRWRVKQLTLIPALTDVDEAQAKAVENVRISEWRREALGPGGGGIVFIHETRWVDDHYEVGSLVRGPGGEIDGFGIRRGQKAVDEVLTQIDALPAAYRSRLEFNGYASTVLPFADESADPAKPRFLTIEFPLADLTKHERIHPISGQREIRVFEQGRLRRIVTSDRIVEINRGRHGAEERTRVYHNAGVLNDPTQGTLLEETHSLDVWFRDLNSPRMDPREPVLSRLRINYITGQIARETFGLFSGPTLIADDLYVTEIHYTPLDQVSSAMTCENGLTDNDRNRTRWEKVLEPRVGARRFLDLPAVAARNAEGDDSPGPDPYQTRVDRRDLVRGLAKNLTFDRGYFGRLVREECIEYPESQGATSFSVAYEFHDEFHFGLVPYRAVTMHPSAQVVLGEMTTLYFEATSRRLTGKELDYTGSARVKTWDYRWQNPVEEDNGVRRTVYHYDRTETTVHGTTSDCESGEEIAVFAGSFDPTSSVWRVARVVWHRPGVPLRTELEERSGFGRLLVTRTADLIESRLIFDQHGREVGRWVWLRDPETGQFNWLRRQECDYRWQDGRRDAEIRTFVGLEPHAIYREISDSTGRLRIDGLRERQGFRYYAETDFEGGGERRMETRVWLNGHVRQTQHFGREVRQEDGTFQIAQVVTPSWGLVATNVYRLDDPLGRPLRTTYEDGSTLLVTAWFPGSSLPRIVENTDQHGRLRERIEHRLGTGEPAGWPGDLQIRYKATPWGELTVGEEQAVVSGTDLVIRESKPSRQIYHDLDQSFVVPLYTVDRYGSRGIPVSIRGVLRTNVIEVFGFRFDQWTQPDASPGPREKVLSLTTVNLRGLLGHSFTRQTIDRAGHILSEQSGRIASLREYTVDEVLAQAEAAMVEESTQNFHDPGWLVDFHQPDGETWKRIFRTTVPSASTDGIPLNREGQREWVTRSHRIRHLAGHGFLRAHGLTNYVRGTMSDPCWMERNPHLPDEPGLWIKWTEIEWAPDGRRMSTNEVILNERGEVTTVKRHLRNSAGQPATHLSYRVPEAEQHWLPVEPASLARGEVPLDTGGHTDFSGCDFAYLRLRNVDRASFRVQDGDARKVVVSEDPGEGEIACWPIRVENLVRWLPDRVHPELAVSIAAPPLLEGEKIVVVSIADLAQAGLDIGSLNEFTLVLAPDQSAEKSLSPLRRLERGGPWISDESLPVRHVVLDHSSGLRTLGAGQIESAGSSALPEAYAQWLVELNGLTVAEGRSSPRNPWFPDLILIDATATESSRPLYALSLVDGHYLEGFDAFSFRDHYVYGRATGFQVPRLEIFRPEVLDDQLRPGSLIYGRETPVAISMTHGKGVLREGFARAQNRVAANVFRLAASHWLGLTIQPDQPIHLYLARSDDAEIHTRRINAQPTVAESLLPRRTVPWQNHPLSAGTAIETALEPIARGQLLEVAWQHAHDYESTGLVPTRPGTAAEPYVRTVDGAALILLAVQVGQPGLAKGLLEFYAKQTRRGTEWVHASYDARNGASRVHDPLARRPLHAPWTAEAQVALADAAFAVWLNCDESLGFQLGSNLLSGLIRDFRPQTGEPGGIIETPYIGTNQLGRLTLWPPPARYALRTNARVYLLLRQLTYAGARVRRFYSDKDWDDLLSAQNSLERWFKNRILPEVERTGVVPSGLFEIQDRQRGLSHTAAERWTTTADWLGFLEVAQRLGVARESTHRWLEHLARVHGVDVQGGWGLDWSLAITRPDMISTEMTARFVRVARLLGHERAANYARRSLEALRQTNGWPAVIVAAAPVQSLATGDGSWVSPRRDERGWPITLLVHSELLPRAALGSAGNPALVAASPRTDSGVPPPRTSIGPTDVGLFLGTTVLFYLSVVTVALFWWGYRGWRMRWHLNQAANENNQLVPDTVMQLAEERWAKRVLGMVIPSGTAVSRFSNATVEQNFHMQLRAIHKLVVEWRRRENEWGEADPRLATDSTDEWLTGLDEFCSMAGLYMRWVIKAGRKDGASQRDVLRESEDSNHIWSRLVLYFSEYHWALLSLLRSYAGAGTQRLRRGLSAHVVLLLNAMGLRQRSQAFDARILFNFPDNPEALDLLVLNRPELTLGQWAEELEKKLSIPRRHFVRFIRKYKEFKQQEQPYPIHPWVIEAAKLLPHFLLMGIGALVCYNQYTVGDRPIMAFLWEHVFTRFTQDPKFQACGLVLLAGLILTITAHWVTIYRWGAPMLGRSKPEFPLDRTVSTLWSHASLVLPLAKSGQRWNPIWYQRAAWGLRVAGFGWLGLLLLDLPTPSFATFLIVKGILAAVAFLEVAVIVLPAAAGWFSRHQQARVDRLGKHGFAGWLNQFNLTTTRPTSLLWQCVRYHYRPSAPSGSLHGLVQAVAFYFILAAAFFAVGTFICQEMLPLWFSEKYQTGADWKLWAGGLLFWCTMYLLYYGLFLLFTGVASSLSCFPLKATLGFLAFIYLLAGWIGPLWGINTNAVASVAYPVFGLGLVTLLCEPRLARVLTAVRRRRVTRGAQQLHQQFLNKVADGTVALGIVYMSGDELSADRLAPSLLIERWRDLRDRFGSTGLSCLRAMVRAPDDVTLESWLTALHEAETRHNVTLWHPIQLAIQDVASPFHLDPGLRLIVESEKARDELLAAWHFRRWLVTMMSTSGQSQDTAVNLVDIALRLREEGMSSQTVFYLVQNKYDAGEHNRPAQSRYHEGELGQREKLARLIREVAPGTRAFNIHNWTPFGFKAGGLTGMDLVYEESLRLTNLLLLDRNATVHDLDGLMDDLKRALTDPGVVVILPGRSTTNTLTPIGQGSQLVEEGHRSFLRGLLALLGGEASECLGTGWGNILACFYGRVQRAMVSSNTSPMPLTSRMRRGASFRLRLEGLIGFGPHAVGISEDTWAVSQATHNAIALGHRVKFLRSRALWHKLRETWSHSEWLASLPRWSGGYLQMMHDPLMQQINDFGPLSVFARELRACSGRFYLSAFITLLHILLMPLAILLDLTPFVQILIVLWNFGFIINQVLSVHGLMVYLESSGFQRFPALVAALAALLAWFALLGGSPEPSLPAWIILAFLGGGFLVGIGRWLQTRLRDVLLFGPQLILHALGQLVRQSLEFVISGASPQDARGVDMAWRTSIGPREDKPDGRFIGFINLRTVVWVVGLTSMVLNILALSNLDMLNVLMLLPSLLFSVSTLIGPFIMRAPAGTSIGWASAIPKAFGWCSSVCFYMVVSCLVGFGGRSAWLGWAILILPFAWMAVRALRYVGQRDPTPRLRGTKEGFMSRGTRQRWASEYRRSLVVSMFVLVWFFLVPVPGLFVVNAGVFRVGTELQTVTLLALILLGGIVALSAYVKWAQSNLTGEGEGTGLMARTRDAFRGFLSLQNRDGSLPRSETARFYALFTDIQTYLDQRGYAHAQQALERVEDRLAKLQSPLKS